MSYVIAQPEMMTSAATDLATIGSDLSAAHMAAAPPTVALLPAAADEVSAGITHLFSRYAEDYHALAGRATAFHERFVQHLTAGAGSYGSAEGANVGSLRPLTASAGSSASAIATLQGQLESLIGSALVLLNSIIGPQLTTALFQLLVEALFILTAPISIPLFIILGISAFINAGF